MIGDNISLENITFVLKGSDASSKMIKPLNLTLTPGDIHTILGEKEAGKSIISDIFRGTFKPTSGIISINNKKYKNLTIQSSRRNRIENISERTSLFNDLTVIEQLFMSSQIHNRFIFYKQKYHNSIIEEFFRKYDIEFSTDSIIKNLNNSSKKLLEIIISVLNSPNLIIIDEIISNLTVNDLNTAIHILEDVAGTGCAVLILINHVDFIPSITTHLSLMRNGELILTERYGKLDKYNIIKILYSHVLKNNFYQLTNKDFFNLIKYNQAIINDLPVILIAIDQNNYVRLLNVYAEEYFSVKNSDVFNIPITDLITFSPKVIKMISNIEKINMVKSQIKFKNKNKITNLTIFPILDSNQPIGKILIIDDITKEEAMRQQLNQNEKLASVGMLASGVAHEINHPLGIIQNIMEILKYHNIDKAVSDELESIEEEIKIIKEIISNLIGFSNVENSTSEIFDISELLERVINLVRTYANENGITILYTPVKEVYIFANETDIRQVFLNLIKNSIEATPKGGVIKISIDHKYKNEAGFLEITFEDTGTGIKADNIEDIFLPFYSKNKEKDSGMGLGLYISYNTIKKYKGKIRVENIYGGGAKFTIVFPALNEKI